jgi:predicted transcriptional regulator
MDYQKRASAGLVNTVEQTSIKSKLKNAQRLLRPIKVRNPYAQLIDLPKEVFKPRRTLLLLLNFIETITYYHQYQRVVKKHPETGQMYIESTKEDVEAAFGLLKEVLFSKSDELSKASRKFLERLKREYGKGESFYTQQIRKSLRLSSSSVHRYIRDLQSTGYIKYKGGNKYKGFEYEIADMEEYTKLKSGIDEKLNGILAKIEGVPVSQVYPTSENGILEVQSINDLS